MKNTDEIMEQVVALVNDETHNRYKLLRLDLEERDDYIKELEEKLETLEEVIHLKVKKYRVYDDGSLNTGYIDETDHYFDNNDDMLSFSASVRQEIGFISILSKD